MPFYSPNVLELLANVLKEEAGCVTYLNWECSILERKFRNHLIPMGYFYGVQFLNKSVKSFVIFHQFFSQQRNDFYNYLMIWKKTFFLSPGHDRVVTIKSRNFSIAKIWINPLKTSFLSSRKHAPFRCERCWQPPLCAPTSVRWS